MAIVETQQVRDAAQTAAQQERIAQGFRDQGRTADAQRISSRARAQQEASVRAAQQVSKNMPQPSGPVEYVSRKRGDEREKATYEPVTVKQVGSTFIVEKRALLYDPSSKGYSHEVYVKERTTYDANGNVITREVYDKYKTNSGKERSYLRLSETPTERREIVRSSKGEKIRDTKTDLTTGEVRRETLNPNESNERKQALTDLGLTADEIKKLSPGQQKAILNPSQASKYTGTPVPQSVMERVNAQLGGKVSTVTESQTQNVYQGGVLDLGTPQFLGVRAVPLAEQQNREAAQRVIEARKEPGVYQTDRGTVLIREGGKQGQVASQIFKDLGAPEKKLVGEITFGREAKTIIKREGILPEVSFLKGSEEASRKTQIFETTYDIPTAEAARFAGFPLKNQKGEDVQFPARFTVTQQKTEDFAKEGIFDKPNAYIDKKFLALDKATGSPLDPVGRGVKTIGKGIRKVGEKVETLKATEGSVQILEPGARFIGGALEEVGGRIEERPVSFGVGQAVILGTGFGELSKGASALRETGYFLREGAEVKKAGTLARFARGTGAGVLATEKAAGIGLGLGFVGQTSVQTYLAPSAQERGKILAGAGFEVIGFAGGYKLGTSAAGAGVKGLEKADSAIFKKTQSLETGEVRRTLRPEIEKPLQQIESAVAKPFELTREGIESLAPGRRGEIGGRSAKQRSGRITKAEQRKNTFNQAYNRQVTFSQGELVVRARNEGLKQNFVKERVVRVDPLSQQITSVSDTGLRTDLPQLKGEGTPMNPKKLYGGKRGPGGVQSQALAGLGKQLKVDYSQGETFVARRNSRTNIFEKPKQEQRAAPEISAGGGEQMSAQRVAMQKRAKLEFDRQKREPVKEVSGGRTLADIYGRQLKQKDIEFEDVPAPQGWEQQRPEEAKFFRGSPLDRRARAFAQLRELARKREEQVSGQLPAVRGERDVTVFEPGKSEISRVINEERALNVRRMGEASALKPALELSTSSAERFRSPLDIALAQNSRLSFTSIQSVAQTQAQDFDVSPAVKVDLGQEQSSIETFGGSSGRGRSERDQEERRPPLPSPGGFGGGGSRGLQEELLKKPTQIPGFNFEGDKKFEKGYFALVKRFGRFEKVTAVPLGREEALTRGLNVAEGGAGQTVKLVEAGESVRASTGQGLRTNGLLRRFTSLGGGLYREKRKYAINTPGELQEITFKGIAANSRGLRV